MNEGENIYKTHIIYNKKDRGFSLLFSFQWEFFEKRGRERLEIALYARAGDGLPAERLEGGVLGHLEQVPT